MFRTKLLLILPLVVAVALGQANRSEEGQWLFFSLGRPMLVTGHVIAAPEAPVPISIPAFQPGKPAVVVPLPDEPVPTGEQTLVTEQPPASVQNVYNIIYLQYEPVVQPKPVTQCPPPTPKALPPFPPMTSYPTGSHPTQSPSPPRTVATQAPSVVVTTESHPAVTQAPGQLMFDFQCKEEDGYYSVEHECNTYIECKQNRAMKYTCPGGLHFNPAAKYNENPCAYPSEVKCMPCDQEQSLEPTALCARIEAVVQPEPATQYPPPTPKALPPFPPMTSYPTGSHPTQTPSPPRTVATQTPPLVVPTESHPALTQAPKQLMFDGQSKETNGYYPVEAPIAPAPIFIGPSTPAAPPALAAPSYATVLHPRPLYTPVHRRILSPRPIRLAPTAVVPPQLSAIGEPQPPVQGAAPLVAPVVVTTQSHPAVTQAPGQLMLDFQCKEENGYYSVEHECNTYIECKQNRAMKYTCPGGLHFNPAAKYNENPCAYPSEVKCMPCDQEQSPEPTALCARIEAVVQPEPVTQYPPPTPKALPPFPPMTSYPTGSHPTQTPSPPRTVATQAPPVVVPTESHPALTQAPKQLMFDGQSKETNGYYPVEAPIAPAPIFIGPSTPAAPPALAAPSYTTVLHPRPRYTPVHRRILSPRPIRLAPTAVVPPQLSAIGEPQPPVQGAAPLVAPVVVTTQSHPAVTQAPGQLMLDFQCKEENGYYSVEHECNTYIECKQNRAMKYTCPGGLHFNPAAKYNENPCAYPSEVKCMPCDQEQSPEPTAVCARIEPVVQPEPVTQYPPPTPKALPPFPPMTSYPTGSHPTQTPSPPRTVATQAPPVVVTTESHPALTQAPKQLIFDGQSKEANGYYPVEAPIAPAPIFVGPSTPAAPPALAAPSYATVLHPRPLYTPVHRRILSPRPIRLAPTAVVPPQLSAIGEPQPPVQEAAPLAAPVVVTTQSHPAVTQAPGQLMFDFQCKEENGYYSVEHECNTYIECKQNRAMKYTCPGGLHFNPAAKYNENPCAYPSEVKCMPESPKPIAECPVENAFYSMSDGDCSQYIRCHEGIATIMKCPEGLAFNPQKNVCDWPANVIQCNLNVGEMK